MREGAAQLRRDRKRKEPSNDSSSHEESSALRGTHADKSSGKRKKAIVEIEVVEVAMDEGDRLSAQLEGEQCERDPRDISSDPCSMSTNERRDDVEESLSSDSPGFQQGSKEISNQFPSVTCTIRPDPKLTSGAIPVTSVDSMSEEERSLYLTFLPPRPKTHRGPRSGKQKIIRVR